MLQPSTSSSALPATAHIETFYVKLPNGKIVTRTADELAELPDELRTDLVFLNPETGRV